jgi:uncharacterized protein (TIGR03083 family)
VDDPFPLIAAERRTTADWLETIDESQWAAQSLCAKWTVREVAAHLVMPFRISMPRLLLKMAAYRGNFDRLSEDFARDAGTDPTETLTTELRANAEHRFSPPGLGPLGPLSDVMIHSLDMRVPLDAGWEGMSPEGFDTVLAFLMTPKATRGFLPKDRVAGLRFEASDTGWTHGQGPTVRGPAASLAMAVTGRRAGLDGLEGDGVPELRGRIGG